MVYICVYSFRETNQTKNHFKMKTLLRGICLVALIITTALSSQAQVKNFLTATSTVTNTEVKTIDYKVLNAGAVKVTATAVKATGTPGGVVRLFGSNDKVSWTRFTASGTLAAGDSLILTNVATPQSITFKETASNYLYYRLTLTGSGTQTTAYTTTLVSSH